MKEETRQKRENAIADAAYAVLAEKGFAGTSMLAVARRAKASNETMYRWYGDKLGLFRALIVANAADVKALLEQSFTTDQAPLDVLSDVGPVLLGLLVSDRAIALNRAAAADASGALGEVLTQAGRETIAPLVADVIRRALEVQNVQATRDDVALYLDLLVGDLQIRRAIGALGPLSKQDIQDRADLALVRFRALMSV